MAMQRKGKSREGTSDILDKLTADDQQRSREGFEEKAAMTGWNDPKVFARNLYALIQMQGLTLKKTADKIGAKYQWIRRIVTRGMVRITEENRPYLNKLARLFQIGKIEDLWKPDLIEVTVQREGPALAEDLLREKKLVPYAQKLILLLASGKHEYLKELIDRLHGTLTKELPQEADDDADN